MNLGALEWGSSCSSSVAHLVTGKGHRHRLVWKSRQIIWIKHDEPPTKRMEVKMNRASFLCENRSGHYNLNLKTWRHVTGHNEQHTPLKIGCELGCYIKVSSSSSTSDTRVSHSSSFRSPLHLDVSFRYESGVFCRASTSP